MSNLVEHAANSFSDPLGDERLRFYLKNRSAIEQWAALGKEVTAAVDDLLQGLGPDIEARVIQPGDDVPLGVYGFDGSYPRFALARQHWPRISDEPQVSVTFEWHVKTVNPAGQNAPYLGIRFSDPRGTDKAIMRAVRERGAALPGYVKFSDWWPVFRKLPAAARDEWWADVPAWRAEMTEAIAQAWEVLDPVVTSALSLQVPDRPTSPGDSTTAMDLS